MQTLNEKRFWNFRHAHSCQGFVEALTMFLRTENTNITVLIFKGLHSFKNRLSVMQRKHRRRHWNILERNNFRGMPFIIKEIGYQHVVRNIFSEFNVVEINIFNS